MPLLLLLVLVCVSLSAQGNRYEGRPVTAISIQPPGQYLDPADLKTKLAALKPGRPLTMQDVRTTMERLYASGRFENITVDATDSGSGVALTFLVSPASFVRGVSVVGVPDPPSRGQLVN